MIPQAREYGIPIYVSDNGSTDNTVEVLKSFQKTYPLLRFKSNKENLGVDRNMVSAARMASTRYVWCFGSRRILLPGTVRKVHNLLSKNSLDLVVLNDLNSFFIVPESGSYSSSPEVFRKLSRNISGLGFQILPSDAWKQNYLWKYDGTEWMVFGLTFEFIARKKNLKAYFISEPCATHSGESNWRPRFFQIWANWKKVVRSLPKNYSAADRECVIRNSINYLFVTRFRLPDVRSRFTLFDLRVANIYNAEVFRAYRKDIVEYGGFSPNVAYAVARFPIALVKLYYRIYDTIRAVARKFIHQKTPLNPTAKREIACF